MAEHEKELHSFNLKHCKQPMMLPGCSKFTVYSKYKHDLQPAKDLLAFFSSVSAETFCGVRSLFYSSCIFV